MSGISFPVESFVVTQEGGDWVATDHCGSDDFAVLEIQSDSLDTLMTAIRQIRDYGLHTYIPGQPAPMPKWYEPYELHGDCSRIILPSRDQRRLFEMTQARKVVSALAGAVFAFSVWGCVSLSTHPLLVDIATTANGWL